MAPYEQIWIDENVDEIANWCEENLIMSEIVVAYRGSVLVFICKDQVEETLFRCRWGHLI